MLANSHAGRSSHLCSGEAYYKLHLCWQQHVVIALQHIHHTSLEECYILSSKNYHLFLLLRVKNLNLSCDLSDSQVTLSSTTRWGWEVYAICWYINGHIYFFQFICDFLTSCLVTQVWLEYSTVGPVRLWSAQS